MVKKSYFHSFKWHIYCHDSTFFHVRVCVYARAHSIRFLRVPWKLALLFSYVRTYACCACNVGHTFFTCWIFSKVWAKQFSRWNEIHVLLRSAGRSYWNPESCFIHSAGTCLVAVMNYEQVYSCSIVAWTILYTCSKACSKLVPDFMILQNPSTSDNK